MHQFVWYVTVGFTIVMAVTCYRRGQAWPWIWIILILQPLGGIAYLVVEILGLGRGLLGSNTGLQFRTHSVSGADLRRAEAEVRRLGNGASWSDYATALRARKRHEEAVDAARQALGHDPDDVHARYELGRALLATGRPDEAARELQAVVEAERNFDYGDALLGLAKAREASGDLQGARDAYALLADTSSRPEVLVHLAEVEVRLGHPEAARACVDRVVDEAELAPDFARGRNRPWVARARRLAREL